MVGLGLLASGSGAAFTSAAFNNSLESEATLGVIADAGLRVRSARDNNDNPIVADNTSESDIDGLDNSNKLDIDDTGELTDDYETFIDDVVQPLLDNPGAPSAAALEINEEVNTELGIRSAFTNRLDGEIGPLLEVTNNDPNTEYEITISYANDDGEEDGYGDNVSDEHSTASDGEVAREVVQAIYQFSLDETDPDGRNSVEGGEGGRLISPDPDENSDEGANIYQLGASETAFIKMEINTDEDDDVGNLVGEINSAAGGGNEAFTGNVDLNLLNNIYITAEEVEE